MAPCRPVEGQAAWIIRGGEQNLESPLSQARLQQTES